MSRSPSSVLDEPMLLARLGGNRALALGLLREFYVTHADVVHRVRAALRAEALPDAFRLLHRTAGTAANLGLAQLAAVAAQAETAVSAAIKDGRAGAGLLDLDAVERCLHEALAEIQGIEERLSDRPLPPAARPDSRRRAELMARLNAQLRASDLEALDTAADLAPLLGPDAGPLSSALARLDFVEAAGILGALTIREGEPRCPSSRPARC
ncbi:Hpt domain-containing protein [Novispirillum sp. DQ9]|uniref:Hpt domain-containing protein n=1 Tax=Novispirillum sp. DQ9 TaxID=3398612 RepID=UPI003C7DD728